MKMTDLCANLVPMLGVPASEFNELLRALREGSVHFREKPIGTLNPDILKAKPGPGGGLIADAFRTAFVIVALMIDAPRQKVAENTWSVWHFEHDGATRSGWTSDSKPRSSYCSLTGQPLFGEAVRAILEDEDLACRVDFIEIGDNSARIVFDGGRSENFGLGSMGVTEKQFYRASVLRGVAVQGICQLIQRD